MGHFERRFQREGSVAQQPLLVVIALSCGIKTSAVHHSVLSQSTRVTDRQTDRRTDGQTNRITTPKTALAYARAVKTAGKPSQRHQTKMIVMTMTFQSLLVISSSIKQAVVSRHGYKEAKHDNSLVSVCFLLTNCMVNSWSTERTATACLHVKMSDYTSTSRSLSSIISDANTFACVCVCYLQMDGNR